MAITEEDLDEIIELLKELWQPAVFRKKTPFQGATWREGVDKSKIAEKINTIISKVEALKDKL